VEPYFRRSLSVSSRYFGGFFVDYVQIRLCSFFGLFVGHLALSHCQMYGARLGH
jgi:hypothetical protein